MRFNPGTLIRVKLIHQCLLLNNPLRYIYLLENEQFIVINSLLDANNSHLDITLYGRGKILYVRYGVLSLECCLTVVNSC